MKDRKIFFDTEFTGLNSNAELLSIGCITEAGDMFYGECVETATYNLSAWVQTNVINNMIVGGNLALAKAIYDDPSITYVVHKKPKEVIDEMIDWAYSKLSDGKGDIQFVSDCCHYDFMLLVDLVVDAQYGGTALSLPKGISPVCYDINQLMYDKKFPSYIESLSNAFDVSRENMAMALNKIEFEKINMGAFKNLKHNSLYDARIIKLIYDELQKK